MLTHEAMKDRLKKDALRIEIYLSGCLKNLNIPENLLPVMEYSLLAGGKRLRPVLCLTTASIFGLSEEAAIPFASGLECIHTYSLIHDDLPSMDDDDLRRGKPTNHKIYGEALAILAGDALLTEAFGLMLKSMEFVPTRNVLKALEAVVSAVGATGMVGGQALDMAFTGKDAVSLPELADMQARKTGALIKVSCLTGALLAGASEHDCKSIAAYGAALGAAFQVTDDILDEIGDTETLGKPVGSDQAMGKTTYPALVGIAESREYAKTKADEALDSITKFSGQNADFLRSLVLYTLERVN